MPLSCIYVLVLSLPWCNCTPWPTSTDRSWIEVCIVVQHSSWLCQWVKFAAKPNFYKRFLTVLIFLLKFLKIFFTNILPLMLFWRLFWKKKKNLRFHLQLWRCTDLQVLINFTLKLLFFVTNWCISFYFNFLLNLARLLIKRSRVHVF